MIISLFLFGLVLGSFLNVLIDRLANGESVLWGRSHCDKCKKTLRWFELIPLLSFLLQRGRCLRCHTRLSLQYPVVELVTAAGLLYGVYGWSGGYGTEQINASIVAFWIIFSSLLVIFFADLKYQIIPDSMLTVGVIGAFLLHQQIFSFQFSVFSYLLSGLGASAFFFALWIITRGRGMGFGDVKLAFLLGFILGFPKIIVALYIAFLTGAILGVILILGRGKKLKTKIAFGPFLILGTLIAAVWGEKIIGWWRNFL